jgi:hypothetical protein
MKGGLSVLFEFAMTPDLFDASVANTDKSGGVILVELLRGIAENGLLANLHKDRWLRHVTERRTPTLSPALRDKVLNCLSILHDRHRLVRHPKCITADPVSDMDWLNLALESHRKIPFHAIVLSQPLIESCNCTCDAFVEFFCSLDSAQWSGRRKRTLTVTKSDADYRRALTTILRHAKSLALIDPWFNSRESRYFDTLAICSNLMGQREHARLQGRIDIHAEAGKQRPYGHTVSDYLDAWEQKLRPMISTDGHRFRVFLWESFSGSEHMHDRFILTDQCALSVPGGLDCRTHSHPSSTDWSLLDEEARLGCWNKYDPSVSPFQLLGSRELI